MPQLRAYELQAPTEPKEGRWDDEINERQAMLDVLQHKLRVYQEESQIVREEWRFDAPNLPQKNLDSIADYYDSSITKIIESIQRHRSWLEEHGAGAE